MITCKELAQEVKNGVREQISKRGIQPTLAIITVGDDPASAAYVKGKIKDCEEVGILPIHVQLPADASQGFLHSKIIEAHCFDAIILQLPLPRHLNAQHAIALIAPEKDVDGLTRDSFHTPCTARGIYEWLRVNTNLQGKHVCIINRSQLVGRPLAKLLLDANAAVTMLHSKVDPLLQEELYSRADVVVVGVGKPLFLDADKCKSDAIIVDVGINRVDGKLWGDVDSSICFDDQLITPVPGGVGLLTRAYLMANVLSAYVMETLRED